MTSTPNIPNIVYYVEYKSKTGIGSRFHTDLAMAKEHMSNLIDWDMIPSLSVGKVKWKHVEKSYDPAVDTDPLF